MKHATNQFLLLDTRIVSATENLSMTLGRVEKCSANPLFVEEYFANPPKKWEVRYDNLYPNVIYDEKERLYKLWYNIFIGGPQSGETPLDKRHGTPYTGGKVKDGLLYATSKDGVSWSKPNLGLIPFDGADANNIVMSTESHGIHGVGVLRDVQDPDPARLYKAFFRDSKARRMAVAFSADGLHWDDTVQWPEHDAVGDTHNNTIRMDDSSYVGITRGWTGEKGNRLRMVLRTESSDFIHWSDPANVFQGKDAHDQIYSMPIFRHGNLYLGLPAMFHKGDPGALDWDTVDTELAWSPDTISWNRVCHGEALIPRGEGSYPTGEYDCGCIYAAAPILVGDTHHIYYGGSNGLHNNWREGSFCLATLPRDRFAGYSAQGPAGASAASDAGRLTTTPFRLDGAQITINVDVPTGASARAGIVGSEGRPIPGFGLDDCIPMREGGLDVAPPWKKDIDELVGRDISLIIEIAGATLYGISGQIRFE